MPENGHVGERLSAYLDGELEPKAHAIVAAHLAACDTCAGELEELRQLQAQLLETSVPDPGPAYWSSFAARVQGRLAASEHAAPSTWLERWSSWFLPSGALGWLRLAGVFATVTLVAYLGMRGFRPESTGRIEPLQPGREGTVITPRETRTPSTTTDLETAVEPEAQAHRAGEPEARQKSPGTRSDTEKNAGRLAKRQDGANQSASKQESAEGAPAAASRSPQAAPVLGALGSSSAPESVYARLLTKSDLARESRFATEPKREEPATAGGAAPASEPAAAKKAPPASEPVAGKEAPRASEPTAVKELERSRESMAAKASAAEPEVVSKDKVEATPVPGAMLDQATRESAAKRMLSPRRNEAVATHEARLAPGGDEATELPVRDFVAAALAGDTLAARAARDRFAAGAAPGAAELASMQTWLDEATARTASVLTFNSSSSAPPRTASLTALDDLIWPRRERPALRQQVEELGRRLVEESAARPGLRPRAQAYVGWLAVNAADATSRAEWQRQLELLR